MPLRLSPDEHDRARGTLLGLAVGDALGTTLESTVRDSQTHHAEMTGGGPFDLRPGRWTDDTSMALALAESLVERQGFDARDLMTRFVAWRREGAYSCTGSCFDTGIKTQRALTTFGRNGNPFAGSTAPAVLYGLLGDDATARDLAREQGRVTHGAAECLAACALLADILRDAIQGRPDPLGPRGGEFGTKVSQIARGIYRGKTRDQIRSTGYVVDTLEAALWCTSTTDSFEAALVLAVNLGHDADTVGAVAGQIAGALHGASAISQRWLTPLAWRERIEGLADRLVA